MKPQSRKLIHVGTNFLVAPSPVISQQSLLLFQQAIFSQGLEYQKLHHSGNQLVLLRESPSTFQVTVGPLADLQIGQILIIAPNLITSLNLFIQEAEAALNAFEIVWPMQNRQIVQSDATIRELYETTSQHAFQELWEKRLGQSSQALMAFGKPIRGGGLRFVMDPLPNETHPAQIEVKIESYLKDTSKIFVETQFTWLPSAQGAPFDVRGRVEQMNSYIENQIHQFISGESQ